MTVLIIHRQQSFLQRIKQNFLQGGWRVHTTDNGLDGLLTVRHHQFDLILCGFDLPVVSGTEVVRSLRLLSQNRVTPVFFLRDEDTAPWQMDMAEKLSVRLIKESAIKRKAKLAWLQ